MHAGDTDLIARLFLLPVALTVDPFALVLVFGSCLHLGWISDPVLAGPAFAGFGNPVFLFVAAVLYVLHTLADKIPPVGHLFDGLGVLVKPIAAALIGFWLAHKLSAESSLPWYALSVVVLGGVPATYALQITKTKTRAGLSAATLGFLHPVVSGFETIAGLILSLAFVLHPLAGLLLAIAVLLPIGWLILVIGKVLRRGLRKIRGQLSASRS
jgi:Domain of unknown function (DUF4126)